MGAIRPSNAFFPSRYEAIKEIIMTIFNVPTRDEVSSQNQAIFDTLKKSLGMVPNLYATFAHSETALGTYLALQNAKSSLMGKAREVVNLVVSQVNDCEYCLAAHTALGKMVGFTDEQIMELRHGRASFDAKFDSLARLAKSVAEHRGRPEQSVVDSFFAAGWTKENLVDAIVIIGDKTTSNYLHSVTKVPVDFPAAPPLA
jgi:AhpD family alkylhydroperoxidase